MNSRELLGEFLDDVWGKGPIARNVYLAYKPNPNSFDIPPAQRWPDKRESVLEFIQGVSARGQNIYYNPAMFKPDSISNEKEWVLASWVLWVDFDGNADEARVRLAATPDLPRPSWELQTGLPGHEHWYWILDRPEPPERFEVVNQKLAYYLEGDVGCWNSNRVMRPPYTQNYMDARKYEGMGYTPQPVDFLKKNDLRYSLSAFDLLPDVKSSIMDSIEDLDDIPPMSDVFAKYKWDERHLDLFKNPPMQDRSGAMVRLAYFGAEVGMTNEAIYAVISDVDNRVGKFRDRNDRERRLAQIIAKVRIKHPYQENMSVHQTKKNIKLVYTANELLDSEFQIEWLIDKLLVAHTINFLSAESGIGKSRLAMQLARAMATGTQFLKWPVKRQISVMYLSLEMAEDMCKHFLSSLNNGNRFDEEASNKLMFYPAGQALDISTEEGYGLVEMLIKEYKPEIVMIDAMGKLTFDEMGETQAKAINNQLNKLIQEYGTTFLLIHHNRKPDLTGKKRPGLGDVYGNQYVVTDASTVLTMFMPENQAHVELIFVKSRAMEAEDYIVMNGKKGFSFVIKEKEDFEQYDRPGFDFSQV